MESKFLGEERELNNRDSDINRFITNKIDIRDRIIRDGIKDTKVLYQMLLTNFFRWNCYKFGTEKKLFLVFIFFSMIAK